MSYLISTIIPVYNCEKYLSRAVESVIAQSDFDEIELILVDDGSRDNSGMICDEYAGKYENIITIHQKNSGVSVARNKGMEISSGKWISFVDSDDYIKEDFYVKLLSAESADLICCNISSNESMSNTLQDFFKKSHYVKDEFNTTVYSAMANYTSFFPCWNKIYLKSIIDDNNLQFAPGVKLGEDMMFVFDYVKFIESFTFVDEPLYFYYINPNNTTCVVNKGFEAYLEQYKWQYKYFNSLNCDRENLLNTIRTSFVYRTVMAISSAGYELGLFDGIKYLKQIITNETFVRLYEEENYTTFVCKFDKQLNGYIKRKKPVSLYFLLKIYKSGSKLLKKR